MKEIGSDHVLDYHVTEHCVEKIRQVTGDQLKLAFGCVGAFDSHKICADAMAPDGTGCLYNSLSPTPFPREDVKSMFTPGEAVLGENLQMVELIIPSDEELFKAHQ
jgi:NADPH:quinone reductase-like Zn-dependent oxidoreductase